MMNLTEAGAQLGVPQNTLTNWLKAGLVRPPGWQCRQRVPVNISSKEFQELRIIRDLRRTGASLQMLRKAAALLRSLGGNPFSRGDFLVVADDVVRVLSETDTLSLVKKAGQLVLVRLEV